MPQYNLEYLVECITKDSAILVGSYDHLTIKSRIQFLCKCGIEGNKNFKRATISGFYCDDCTLAKCKTKVTERSQRKTETNCYNMEILEKYLQRDNASLKYELPNLRKEARITFLCNCGNEGDKTFRYIKETGMFCKLCTFKYRSEKRELTNLERYGNKCTLQSESIKHKAEETCMQKYGVKNAFQSKEIQTKIKQTNLEKYGAENPYASKEIISKIRKNCKEKYGTEFPMQTKELKEKVKQTNMEKYGVPVTSQAESVKEKARHTNLLIYGHTHHVLPEMMNKAKQTNLERYGTEYTFQAECIKEKIKTTLLERYGADHIMKVDEFKEKSKATNIEKLGVPFPTQCETVRNKCKATNIIKYGVEYATQSDNVKNKTKETCLHKYGTTCTLSAPEIKEKATNTIITKYGVDNVSKSEEIKSKKVTSYLSHFGVDHPLKTEEVQEKQIQTNLARYGTRRPTQSPEIQNKIQTNGLRFKPYICPSGITRNIQGYEHFALDRIFLTDKLPESDVYTDRKDVPRILYNHDSKQKYYFPDIWIKSQNKLIEVKSTWTYTLHKETNILKWRASKENGYKHEFWIFTPKGHLTIITNPEL